MQVRIALLPLNPHTYWWDGSKFRHDNKVIMTLCSSDGWCWNYFLHQPCSVKWTRASEAWMRRSGSPNSGRLQCICPVCWLPVLLRQREYAFFPQPMQKILRTGVCDVLSMGLDVEMDQPRSWELRAWLRTQAEVRSFYRDLQNKLRLRGADASQGNLWRRRFAANVYGFAPRSPCTVSTHTQLRGGCRLGTPWSGILQH